jgi:hypothetical protein
MADQFPNSSDNSPINLYCTRPLRGKEFSVIMKQKGNELKAKKKSHTPSASSSAPFTSKKGASSAPSMLLTRAGAAKKLQEAVTGGGGGGLNDPPPIPNAATVVAGEGEGKKNTPKGNKDSIAVAAPPQYQMATDIPNVATAVVGEGKKNTPEGDKDSIAGGISDAPLFSAAPPKNSTTNHLFLDSAIPNVATAAVGEGEGKKNTPEDDEDSIAVGTSDAPLFSLSAPAATPPKNSTEVDIIGDQWNLKKKKIFFGGRPYKCNKVKGDPEKKGSIITKYYSCQMVLFNGEGERWKPLQLPKGSSSVEPPKKKAKTASLLTYNICKGTLHGFFSMSRGKMKHSFRAGNINHICHNPTWVEGTTLDLREPLMFIVPSVHWQITDALINSVKHSLKSIKSGWAPLGHCGSARQYLPGLSSTKSMTNVRDQVTALLTPFVKNNVTNRYPALINFKVGAIRSRGYQSQQELMGTLHRDFSDETNTRTPEERPQSIILALDPFNFLYEHHVGGGKLVTMELHVPSGHGIVFTSLLNHAGGANECADKGDESKYVYRLFAYIVSDMSHYPAETGTRITIPDAISKEKNEKYDDTGVILGHTMAGRQIVATKKFTYDEEGKHK